MQNRTNNILESIKTVAGEDSYQSVLQQTGAPQDKPSPKQQAQYIQTLLNALIETKGEAIAAKVMRPCGGKCISNITISKAKELYIKSKDLFDFLTLLNQHKIGGGRLHRQNGKIIGVYGKCYCGVAKHAGNLSPLYCNCSAGWYERLFSSVFEKKAEVRIVSTILSGADECMFEITV